MRAVLLACLVVAMVMAVQASEYSASMDELIAVELPDSGSPGLAYAMVDQGQMTSEAWGEVLMGSGVRVTTDTPFTIGSISKSFTALAIMQLVEAGEIDLDSPVSLYLEVFRGRPAENVTVRQLLSHTSGYSTRQGNDPHDNLTEGTDELQNRVARIAEWTPPYAPERQWQYSNANYLILGALIETLSGQDFADYLESEILEPVGMDQSFVADGKRYDAMATGHQPWFGSKRPLGGGATERATAPTGGVIATAPDLGRYLSIMLNGEDDIISAAGKAAMLRPASDASPFYGLGWFINTSDGTAYHSGLTPGVETLATLSPEKRQGVVVLINANSGMGFGTNTRLFNRISARAFGLDDIGEGRDWGTKTLFLTYALLPLVFLLGIVQLAFNRDALLAKSGRSGAFSLWFPLLMTLALAWSAVVLIPGLFGVSLSTFALYQPDFVIALVATAVMGVAWSLLRLGVFYGSKPLHARMTKP